jgi:acyl carrier protein
MDTMDQLTDIFRSVFNDETIELADQLTADDIDGWDSIAHINLIFAVEAAFGVTFSTSDLKTLATVGDLRKLIEKRVS